MNEIGKWLVLAGVIVVIIGLLLQMGWLSWFGRLPGDIRVERPGLSFYFPFTSMLVISGILSLAAWVLRRLLG
ncbi:MAG: DUF2905 family protein [Pseudomonadales bacterium]|nr:DUF2905 domain-containing protein [Pseudomonadales bacterium]NIX08722.1 DUF2905 family protein [Pseudomonadales bacterium]